MPKERVLAADGHAVLPSLQQGLLADVLAIVDERGEEASARIDRNKVARALDFACRYHAGQRRLSGEEFIHHPVGVAKICAGMRLDTDTLCAALLHDTVEDTAASLTEIRDLFGEAIANLVDGTTKLHGMIFSSSGAARAMYYQKMTVAMANDVRVILIKLADRLHNMRTIEAMPKQKQIEKGVAPLEGLGTAGFWGFGAV